MQLKETSPTPPPSSLLSSSSAMSSSARNDRITISFYGTEQNRESFNAAVAQIPNIRNILQKFTEAATRAHRPPPEIVISMLMIPDWEHGSSYNSEKYKIISTNYIYRFKLFLLNDSELKNIIVEDFYAKNSLTPQERAYLQNLVARGSNADMIKTHAIICPENQARRHLQLDSNTQIFDFHELYMMTFGSQTQLDALNASYYDRENEYISAHNKIVYSTYTTPGGQLVSSLKSVHIEYCDRHKDDMGDEKTTKNSIYSKDFVVALESIGLTFKKTIQPTPDTTKVIYLANMNRQEYRITRCIATAVNMSWRECGPNINKLKQLPSIQIGHANCDFACFANAVAKHVDSLGGHDDDPYDDTQAHNQLMAISSVEREKEMIRLFINNVAENKIDMIGDVINILLPKTQRGSQLFQELFRCSPEEFIKNAIAQHEERSHSKPQSF